MLIVFYITAAAVSRRHEAVETAMDSLERSLGDLIEHRRVHTEGSVPAKKPLLRNLAANSDAHMITTNRKRRSRSGSGSRSGCKPR